MAAKSSLGRRIFLTILIVLVVAVGLGIGEVFRRFFEREEVAAIRNVLTEARTDDRPLAGIDPAWPELSESLRERLEDDPTGLLAVQAYRAVMRVSYDLPGSTSLAVRSTATLKYGALVPREIPFPDQEVLWTVRIQGSWDNGPWFEWYRGAWPGEGTSEVEFQLDTGVTDAQRERGHAIVKLRVLLRLYLGDEATAAAAASGTKELNRLPFTYQEHEAMGHFRILELGARPGSRRR